ncbi:hypothetical protein V2J85_16540 [Streptomyces sp. DSM 41528]|uniref:Uncharacterized protein n=1 Tax=Streptomyces bugieae TaxID=3098223 RepID=A0ABU7NQ39_9ACTN|nr:hypothetical protein [Streptomyces sp. DSM 41528]
MGGASTSAVRAAPTTTATTATTCRSSTTPSAPGVGGENVDIKDGTTGAKISGNGFDGASVCPVTIAGDITVTGGRGAANPGVPVG